MNKQTEVKKRQSIQDVTIQEAGSLEDLINIALKNNISITDELITGRFITSDTDTIVNRKNVNFYTVNEIKPATYITVDEMDEIIPELEGIDYWIVETDFIIQ